MLFLIVFYMFKRLSWFITTNKKKDMPIVKQPSKLITASGHKSFSKQETAVFQIIIRRK
jgi:hypothetical protein